MFKTHAHRTMDMTEGSLLTKVLFFSLPIMLSGILQLLFNAADIIVVAIGQGIEIQGFDQAGVPITRGGRLVAALSGQVNDMDNIFAGGDCVTGPATAIRAIAAGKVAAANIDEHLGFHHEIRVDVDIPAPRLNNRPPHGRINTTERQACERKCDFEDIECGLTEEGAVTEASRCLRCDHFGYGIFRGGRDIKW